MKFKKLCAVAIAAALTAAAPIKGVLPDALCVAVSAESSTPTKVTVDGTDFDPKKDTITDMEHTIKFKGETNVKINFDLDFNKIKENAYVFEITYDHPLVLWLHFFAETESSDHDGVTTGSGSYWNDMHNSYEGDVKGGSPAKDGPIVFYHIGDNTNSGKASITSKVFGEFLDELKDKSGVKPTLYFEIYPETLSSIEIEIRKLNDTPTAEETTAPETTTKAPETTAKIPETIGTVETAESTEITTAPVPGNINTFTDSSDNKAANIQVVDKSNAIPDDAEFFVRADEANSSARRIAYNCYFTYNGAEYEPLGTVTVKIPVPAAMSDIANTLKVYHLLDGKYINMNAKVEDGFLVFDTDHFSTYVITDENLTENSTSSTPAATEESSAKDDKETPDTGISSVMPVVGIMAIAGICIIIADKKRK